MIRSYDVERIAKERFAVQISFFTRTDLDYRRRLDRIEIQRS